MTSQDQDFNARIKRVKVKLGNEAQLPPRRVRLDTGSDETDFRLQVLLPQLALVLGAVVLIAGRAISMNYLGVEASTRVLGLAEGGLVLLMLVAIGLMFGKSATLSHGALLVGASLAFLCERYYVPAIPDLMGWIYTPEYVARVILGA